MNATGVFTKGKLLTAIFSAVIISLVNMIGPVLSFVIMIGIITGFALLKKPIFGLAALIILTPFSNTEVLNTQIADIPGLKAANILVVMVVIFYILSGKPLTVLKEDKFFIIGLIVIFTAAVIRSTAYIGETYSMMWDDDFTTTKYLLSHLIRPLLVFLPFIIIVCYVRKERDIKKVIYSIIASIFLLSVTILVLYIFATPNKMNFEHVRAGFGKAIGMHGNNIADFYIAVYPMLLAYTVSKKNLFLTVTTVLSVISIAIIYSRSAYAVVIISTLAFYLVSGRKKWIPLFITAAALGYSIIPETVIERALTGFGGEGLNEISAGRTGDIWIPLFMEFSANPVSIFIGAGRYAVMGTEAFKDGIILKVGHAHSMYFDTLFDSGIIGLGFFIIFFWMLLKKFIESHRTIGDKSLLDLMYGIEISVFAFLIRGITDSFFFPTLTNSFLWITLGLGTAIVYSGKKRDEDMEGQEDKGEAAGDSFISPIQSEVYYDEEYSSNSKQP